MDATIDLKSVLEQHALWARDNTQGKHADLSGAYLSGAYLSGADLSGAYLSRANLYGAIGIFRAGPVGSRGDDVIFVKWLDCIKVQAGCFWDTITVFRAAVTKTHGDNKHARAYALICAAAEVALGE